MLSFGSCVFGWTPYLDRVCRFAVSYSQANKVPRISADLLKFHKVEHNQQAKRISFELPQGFVKRCEFSTTLSTDHPNAEKFLIQLKNDNLEIKDLFSYYVFDTKGLDFPLVPNVSQVVSNTAISEIHAVGSNLLLYLVVGGLGYLGYKSWTKRKK